MIKIGVLGEENLHFLLIIQGLPLLLNSACSAGVAVVILVVRYSRAYFKRTEHCVKCGYDLRGLRNNVCPECGSGTALTLAVK